MKQFHLMDLTHLLESGSSVVWLVGEQLDPQILGCRVGKGEREGVADINC